MYLKSIEMQGFKSFPDRTRLVFDAGAAVKVQEENGVTVIVGPNGSGKSNISDAMRWVLGEISSKTLRSTKMEDVIFGGADSRRPMGFAEVSVTFDNTEGFGRLDCPYDEVTVTRRYFRNSDSEYYINKKAVRLKDIYELFMNTGIGREGYSIIGQGRIAEIISRKSEERRAIFEDASGIAKYRHKKNDSERKLAGVDNNMEIVKASFTEIESQLVPLEKESEKAVKAIDLIERKKKVDIGLWLYDTERLKGETDSLSTLVRHSQFDLQTAEDALAALDVRYAKLTETAQGGRDENGRLTAQINELTQKSFSLDTEFRVLENNIKYTKETIDNQITAKQNAERQLEAENVQLASYLDKVFELGEYMRTKREEYDREGSEIDSKTVESGKLQEEIGIAFGDIKQAEALLTDTKVRISALESAKNSGSDRSGGILEDIEKYREQLLSIDRDRASHKKAAAKYQDEIDRIAAEQDGIQKKLDQTNAVYGEKSEEYNAARLRRDSLNQRINTIKAMDDQLEGYNNAVRFVMKKYEGGEITDRFGNKCGKIYGPLSKLIGVDDKFVTAVETSLGANLQYIVVADEETAKSAMYALKKGNAGRTTFFPLTSMRRQIPTDEMKSAAGYAGYIGVADDMVKCDSLFADVVSSLLGRTLIFDNIDNATAMAKALRYKVRVVTLDGQQINPGGSFTGGSVRHDGSILARANEMKRLEASLEEEQGSVATLEKAVSRVRAEISDLTDEISDSEQQIGLITVLMNTELTSVSAYEAKYDSAKSLLEKLNADYEQAVKMSEQYESDISGLRKDAVELEEKIAAMNEVRASKDEQCATITEEIRKHEENRTSLLIEINGIEKDIETARAFGDASRERINMLENEINAVTERMNSLGATVREYTDKQTVNRKAIEECNRNLSELRAKTAELEHDIKDYEAKLTELSELIRMKMSEKEVFFRELTVNTNKLETKQNELNELNGKLWEEYGISREEAVKLGYPTITAMERDAAVKEQTECRNKLRYIGHVDLDAPNKYKAIKERYDEMSTQINDLEKSKADLTDVISQLEVEMKTAFKDAFEQINRNFGETFSELFGGGSAEISLSDPENILESGIEIKAAPPGKIIKNLMQLSGGEQSFIAIALFFAILKYTPTPFCILDEIEAALDEVNVERLARYIKRYSDDTQFIMITHRRGTMAAATRLYGVTMPEHGISKVLQLDINDISKKKERDWDGIFG